jgi:hypothetical protein
MAVTVPARRNSAGEVAIAATIPLDPTGKTLPVGGIDNGNETCSLMLAGSGPGGSTEITIVGTTPTGNTTSTTTNITTGSATIAAGALSIEFILFPSAVGTINGATFDNTSANVIGVYRLDAPPWKPLGALTYTLSAGAGVLTVQT